MAKSISLVLLLFAVQTAHANLLPPIGLSWTATGSLVNFSWSSVPGAAGYELMSSIDAGATYSNVAFTTTPTVVAGPFAAGQYYFAVETVDAALQYSPLSSPVIITFAGGGSGSGSGTCINSGGVFLPPLCTVGSNNNVLLEWNPYAGAVGYDVMVSTDGSVFASYATTPLTLFTSGSLSGSNYFAIDALDVFGNHTRFTGTVLANFGGTSSVPEPGSVVLLGSGILGIFVRRGRKLLGK